MLCNEIGRPRLSIFFFASATKFTVGFGQLRRISDHFTILSFQLDALQKLAATTDSVSSQFRRNDDR